MKPTLRLLSYPRENLRVDPTRMTAVQIPLIPTSMKTQSSMEHIKEDPTLNHGDGDAMVMKLKWNEMAESTIGAIIMVGPIM
jgi:hypothetical protein